MRCFSFVTCVLLFLGNAAVASGPVIRDPGAIYLEDFESKNPQIAVLEEGPIFFDIDMKRSLGRLRARQQVELQAVAEGRYRVKGRAYQGQVSGWIAAHFLQPLRPEFLAELKKANDRRVQVLALIEKNEVALGMTPEEVTASLGKPQKKNSRLDAKGKQEIWEYVRYERVPQTTQATDSFGRTVKSTVYIKVPVGQLAVVFTNDLVEALEKSEGTTAASGGVKIVPAPVELVY